MTKLIIISFQHFIGTSTLPHKEYYEYYDELHTAMQRIIFRISDILDYLSDRKAIHLRDKSVIVPRILAIKRKAFNEMSLVASTLHERQLKGLPELEENYNQQITAELLNVVGYPSLKLHMPVIKITENVQYWKASFEMDSKKRTENPSNIWNAVVQHILADMRIIVKKLQELVRQKMSALASFANVVNPSEYDEMLREIGDHENRIATADERLEEDLTNEKLAPILTGWELPHDFIEQMQNKLTSTDWYHKINSCVMELFMVNSTSDHLSHKHFLFIITYYS